MQCQALYSNGGLRLYSTSKQWFARQMADEFVHAARKDGFRSRAAYKLLQLNQRFNFFGSGGKSVVDLGAAPGSWSQVALQNGARHIIGADLLPIEPISSRAQFFECDLMNPSSSFYKSINNHVDVVMSDMAPNVSGIKERDHLLSAEMATIAIDFALKHLCKNGDLIVKILSGQHDQHILQSVQQYFRRVCWARPEASRKESREIYLVAKSLLKQDKQ